MNKIADEDEVIAALLAAELRLCATMRLIRQRVPEHLWGAIIARALTLLVEDQPVRDLLDKAREYLGVPKG